MRFYNLLVLLLGFTALQVSADPAGPVPLSCSDPGEQKGSKYYTIDLVTTGKVPGTGEASGKAVMNFADSPFEIAISQNGSFIHQLDIKVNDIVPPGDEVYAVWITTPNLDKIRLLGVLDSNFQASGTVKWNKYLVVVTKEASAENLGTRWKGPIVMRGMSKSGYMHTMAGHGPFSQDPCAKYGYY